MANKNNQNLLRKIIWMWLSSLLYQSLSLSLIFTPGVFTVSEFVLNMSISIYFNIARAINVDIGGITCSAVYGCYWRFAIAFASCERLRQGKDSTWFNQLWERFSWISQLTRPNGCILQATLVTNLPESSLSSPAPGTFEIGQAFPITVGSIEDSCTILRCIAGLSSLLEKSWSRQVNGLFSEESMSICVALTRPWQRLGYWSFCLLTSWERERGGEKKHPVKQAGGGCVRESYLPWFQAPWYCEPSAKK